MKKNSLWISLLVMASILLAACGTAGASSQVQGDAQNNTANVDNSTGTSGNAPFGNTGELPLAMKLGLGIIQLDKTDTPLDATQVTQLLTLWKAMRSLSENQTTAAEEIDAVVNQIQSTLTADQLAAIEAMQLTNQNLFTILQDMGIENVPGFGGAGRGGEITDEMRATAQAMRDSGDFPRPGSGGGMFSGPGDGPGQGPGGGQFQEMSPEARETAIAERGGFRGFSQGVNPLLLQAIIQFLEGKAQQ
jgi:predicted small secreted protein